MFQANIIQRKAEVTMLVSPVKGDFRAKNIAGIKKDNDNGTDS